MPFGSAPDKSSVAFTMNRRGCRACRFRWLGWAALAIATLAISAFAHVKAGFTLPSPWNDEPWYMWSAITLAENGTFFSEALNPDRVVPMSPVYQVPMALLFKLAGVSYALGRGMSWAYMACAYLGVLMLVARRPLGLVSAAAASLFFLGASSVVAGNMVRPEALVWALAVWAFVCADRSRHWLALSLAGIGVLVHPAGLFFFAGAFALAVLDRWPQNRCFRPRGWDWPVMLLALVLLAGQAAFIYANWGAVATDAQAAASYHQAGLLRRVFVSNKTVWLALYAVLAVLSLRGPRMLRVPVILGGCALAAKVLRPQMWYEIYNQMGFMWLTLVVPWALHWAGARLRDSRWGGQLGMARMVLPVLAFGAGLIPMLRFCQWNDFITGPNNYPEKLQWGWGMRMDPHPYITEADINAVLQEVVRHVPEGREYRIFFMPEGDALFYRDRLPAHVSPYQGVWTEELADLAVFRISRHPPQWWTEQYVRKNLRRYGGEGIPPFYERDGTEQWILIPPK